jgi:feruloyl esterase
VSARASVVLALCISLPLLPIRSFVCADSLSFFLFFFTKSLFRPLKGILSPMVHFLSVGQLVNSIFHFSNKNNAGSAAAAASTVQASATPSAVVFANSTSSAAAAASTNATQPISGCQALIQALSFPDQQVSVVACEDITAGTALTLPSGPSNCNGGSVQIDLRRVTLNVVTSYASSNYVEVWLPTGQDAWNGRFMATDNKGLSGCPSYDDMIYTSSLGFSVVGDNGGHNNTHTSVWMLNSS